MKKKKTKLRNDTVNAADEKSLEIERLKNSLARALADYDNLDKRVSREREELRVVIRAQFVSQLLPVFDMLYDAQQHLSDQGLAITIQTLESTLKELGIEKVDAREGALFNEEVHEAIETVIDESRENGEIVEELVSGWRFTEGPLIRPAKVKVNLKN